MPIKLNEAIVEGWAAQSISVYNLSIYPVKRRALPLPTQLEKMRIGDLHGNFIKAIYILLVYGAITLSEENYHELYSLHDKILKGKNLTESDYWFFCAILQDKIQAVEGCERLIFQFLGDIPSDRSGNDVLTFRLFKVLREKGVVINTIIGNHEYKFLKRLVEVNAGTNRNDWAVSDEAISRLQTSSDRYFYISSENAFIFLKNSNDVFITQQFLEDVTDFFKHADFITARMLPEKYYEDEAANPFLEITSHAPFSFSVFKNLKQKLQIETQKLNMEICVVNSILKERLNRFLIKFDPTALSTYENQIDELLENSICPLEETIEILKNDYHETTAIMCLHGHTGETGVEMETHPEGLNFSDIVLYKDRKYQYEHHTIKSFTTPEMQFVCFVNCDSVTGLFHQSPHKKPVYWEKGPLILPISAETPLPQMKAVEKPRARTRGPTLFTSLEANRMTSLPSAALY